MGPWTSQMFGIRLIPVLGAVKHSWDGNTVAPRDLWGACQLHDTASQAGLELLMSSIATRLANRIGRTVLFRFLSWELS